MKTLFHALTQHNHVEPMSQVDEEVYSTIFNALRHGVRRRILRMLFKEPMTFTALNGKLGISSSHLTYHLDSLKELVSKNDTKYKLSVFGKAAVDMIGNVEDPPTPLDVIQGLNIYKVVLGVLIVALLLVSGLYSNLSNNYSTQSEMLNNVERELVELNSKFEYLTGLPELINVTKGKWTMNIVQQHIIGYDYIAEAQKPQPGGCTAFYPETDSVMVFYAPLDDVILQVYLTMRNLPEGFYLPLSLQKGNALMNESGVVSNSYDLGNVTYVRWQSPVIWSKRATGWGGIYEIEIARRGWYTLSLTGPVEIEADGYPYVAAMWGDRQWWLDITSLDIDATCKLTQNGESIYYSTETNLIYGYMVK